MSSTETKTELERLEDERKLAEIAGNPRNIEINERTIEAYRKAHRDKGQQITVEELERLEDYHLVKNQKKFDSIVDTSQPIIKKIESMVRQPVTVDGKVRDALYYYGSYRGVDRMGNDIGAEFHEGFYTSPRLVFTAKNTGRTKEDFDEMGERRGEWKTSPAAVTYIHYILLPENKSDRVKFLNDLLAKYPGSSPQSIAYGGHLSYRQPSENNWHSGAHGGNFDWKMFTELSLRELGEVQQTGYYEEDKTGLKKDVKGRRVKYNDNSGKMEAIK